MSLKIKGSIDSSRDKKKYSGFSSECKIGSKHVLKKLHHNKDKPVMVVDLSRVGRIGLSLEEPLRL